MAGAAMFPVGEKHMSSENLIRSLEQRATIYGWLCCMYREEIPLKLLQALVASAGKIPEQGGALPELTGALEELARVITSLAEKDLEEVKEDLDVEYARLFVATGDHPSFPYESVYTDPHRQMMSDAYDEVIKEYQEAGFKKVADYPEPEDHLSLELAFMSQLCAKAAQALRQQKEEEALSLITLQKRFLTRHLGRWVENFCQDLTAGASHEFYKALANFTSAFIRHEQKPMAKL